MKKITMITAFVAICFSAIAQMQTVQLNAKKLQFDDGKDLPAEKAFIVTTEANANVAMVKMQLANGSFEKNKVLYESTWKRKIDDKGTAAILPNHYKLRSNGNYNFRFQYYRSLLENERKQIVHALNTTATALLKNNVQEKESRFKFQSNPNLVFDLLNNVVQEGMVNYETATNNQKPAFSEVIKNMLRNMAKGKMATDSMNTDAGFGILLQQVENEITLLANNYKYVLNETIEIPDYNVEKKNNSLAVNIGYAGIYQSGGTSDLEYLSGPYAGISFPLGNRVFSGNFWNNTSLSVGVFLKDFKLTDSTKISGPVVNKPLYAAIGYKVFNYLKIHAGAAVLEEKNTFANTKSVYLKPFVGLSVELNLWLGFDKK